MHASTALPRLSGRDAVGLTLLSVSVFINYIDRGNLSIAAKGVQSELGLNGTQLGILLSAFFYTYAACQPLAGWLVDRFNVNWVLALGFFVWSSATAITGMLHGFAALLVVRLVLGIGESVAYPAYSRIIEENFPERQRGRANAAITIGQTAGPAFGMFFGAILMARFGWRWCFIVLGLASLLWLAPWLRWQPSLPASATVQRDAPSLWRFLRLRAAWATCGGLFCANYISYFFITWMPYYLKQERHFSATKMGTVAGASYLAASLAAAICGRLSDRWLARGATVTQVRKTFTGGGLLGAAAFLIACVVSPPNLSIAMLMCVTACWAACGSNLWAITQTVAGPAAGRWTGMQNCLGNLAGVVAPTLTGYILDRTGNFYLPFVAAAIVGLIGSVIWAFGLEKVEQVQWRILATPLDHPPAY